MHPCFKWVEFSTMMPYFGERERIAFIVDYRLMDIPEARLRLRSHGVNYRGMGIAVG